jgi:hypothetical protein
VHGPLCEQDQNGGADVTALAPTALARSATPAARAGSESESARAEGPSEAGPEARTERSAATGVVLTEVVAQMFAELPAGLATLLVQRTPLLRPEAETDLRAAFREGAASEGGEWVVHLCLFSVFDQRRVR